MQMRVLYKHNNAQSVKIAYYHKFSMYSKLESFRGRKSQIERPCILGFRSAIPGQPEQLTFYRNKLSLHFRMIQKKRFEKHDVRIVFVLLILKTAKTAVEWR